MDHRSFIRSLSAEQRESLTRKSDLLGIAGLVRHWGLIILLGWLIYERVPFWPLLTVAQGVLIVFLFTLLHETSHRTVFETLWANKAVAWICGLLIALPPEWFRSFHFEHHRHTQNPDKDPEMAIAKPTTVWDYVIYISGLPVWWRHLQNLVRNARGRCDDAFVPLSGQGKVRMEAQAFLLVYGLTLAASLWLGSATLFYVWVLPALLGQPFLRLYLMAEHTGCPTVANMFENSRTTFSNWVTRQIAWNMPYHAEHHAFPAVPFHQLPALHQLTRPHLHVTEKGYIRFHRGYLAAFDK